MHMHNRPFGFLVNTKAKLSTCTCTCVFTHRRAPVCLTTTIMMTVKRKTNPPTPKMTKHHEGIPYSLYSPDTETKKINH